MLKQRRQIIVATLCFCLALTPISALATQNPPQPQPAKIDFKFEKVDLDLLEQVNLLDKRFERDGLVYADEPTNVYLQRVGESLVSRVERSGAKRFCAAERIDLCEHGRHGVVR